MARIELKITVYSDEGEVIFEATPQIRDLGDKEATYHAQRLAAKAMGMERVKMLRQRILGMNPFRRKN